MYTPVILGALGECLRTIYWFKEDLRSFLVRAGVPQSIITSLPWGNYKRWVVKEFLDGLAANPAAGKVVLDDVIGAVVEQDETDGSIALDGVVLLVEAKWTATPAEPRQVREFSAKVYSKLDSTLGLLICMSGFTQQAIEAANDGRMLLLLMDGQDLARIFEGVDDLVDVLKRKRRHAAEKGQALYRIGSG